MKLYRCVFFDLDHTLWDYDRNSRETLEELYVHHAIHQISDFEPFHSAFQKINLQLWDQYDRGLIDRHVIRNDRFKLVLAELQKTDHELSHHLSEHYLELSPTKKNLIPNAIEILDHLFSRYPLYLVTNGFERMQTTKVESGGIRKYFKNVITSEKAGHKKPAREIFDYALKEGGHHNQEAIMIGDNLLTDIAGALNAGIDSVFFNPKGDRYSAEVTYEIADLTELKNIL
jgi:putative hydrolase of the HAD superfamily